MPGPKSFVRLAIRFYKPQSLLIIFAAIILIGAALLCLPVASRNGESVGFIDALFTATSATCVTGLIVVDTFNHWTLFGQLVIISLIQTGGLGFMTIATLFSLVTKRAINYNERLFIQESLNVDTASGIIRMTKHIIIGTFIIELAGALMYSFVFIPEFGLGMGIYKSVFTAISAFCNAGFDLMGNYGDFSNMMPFADNVHINITTMALILIGGIGFVVWEEILKHKRHQRFSLHTKIVLIMTVILFVTGTVMFLSFEYHNPETIGGLTFGNKLLKSMFQSVTLRTAGFNTVDINSLTETSKFFSVILMFIGACPGSTGGGIKVTTVFVLGAVLHNVINGRNDIVAFKRTISYNTVMRSIAILFIGLIVVTVGSIILSFNQDAPFIDVLFETVSAFGTVGITTGLTEKLNVISKLTLIVIMYFGRVGVLTVAFIFARKTKSGGINRVKYPDGRIMVG